MSAPIPSHATAPVRELAQRIDETKPQRHCWGLGRDGTERCMRCDVARTPEREQTMCRRNGG